MILDAGFRFFRSQGLKLGRFSLGDIFRQLFLRPAITLFLVGWNERADGGRCNGCWHGLDDFL